MGIDAVGGEDDDDDALDREFGGAGRYSASHRSLSGISNAVRPLSTMLIEIVLLGGGYEFRGCLEGLGWKDILGKRHLYMSLSMLSGPFPNVVVPHGVLFAE